MSHPNILFFICDDLAYGDLASHGNTRAHTPNLDKLGDDGARFERYLSGPLCTPARAALMTGRHPYRTRAIDTYNGRSMIDPDEITLAQFLGDQGYTTGLFGKWHLGDCYPMRPQDLGFDRVVMHGGGGFRQPANPSESSYFDPELFADGKLQRFDGYCTDIFTDQAIDFIEKGQQTEAPNPFFAYVAYNAPHTPLEIPESYVDRFRADSITDAEARMLGTVANIDENVGNLLACLDRLGIADNTIVVFTSDHGPCKSVKTCDGDLRFNSGLRGHKGTFYEGGIRVPCLLRWPGQVDPNTVINSPSNPIDWFPTFAEITKTPLPSDRPIDGTSLRRKLDAKTENQSAQDDRIICMQWHRGNAPERYRNYAVIGPRYKVTRPHEGKPDELYDLADDPREENDLANENPEIVTLYRQEYERWFDDVSHTRPDNYAPPRIVVGTTAGDPAILTWQDWRLPDGLEGWSEELPGHWLLRLAKTGRYEFQIDLIPRSEPSTLVVKCGDWETVVPVAALRGMGNHSSQFSFALTSPELPAGNADLHVYLQKTNQQFGVIRVRARACP